MTLVGRHRPGGRSAKRYVKKDQGLSWEDVEYSDKSQAVSVRKEMEALFKKEFQASQTNGVNGVH